MKKRKNNNKIILTIGLVFILIITLLVPIINGLSIKNTKNIESENKENQSNSFGDLSRPWNWYNHGIDTDWAGIGVAEARSDADIYEGDMYARSMISFYGKNSAEAWFYHGTQNFEVPDFLEAGERSVHFEYHYDGVAKGIVFGIEGHASVSLKLKVYFAGKSETFTIYSRNDWPQFGDEDRFSETRKFTLENVYLQPGEKVDFYAKLIGYTKAEVNSLTADSSGSIQIFEGYLEKVQIAGVSGAPETIITEGPSGTIDYNDVSFVFTAYDDENSPEQCRFKTILVGYESEWDHSWSHSFRRNFNNLPDGTYTFKVKAKDGMGNEDQTPAEQTFTVDVDEPPIRSYCLHRIIFEKIQLLKQIFF